MVEKGNQAMTNSNKSDNGYRHMSCTNWKFKNGNSAPIYNVCAMLTHTHTWNQKPFARLSIFNWTSCASMNSKTSSFVSINDGIIWFQRLPPEQDRRNRGIGGQSLLQVLVNQLALFQPGGRLCPRGRPKLNIIGPSQSFLLISLRNGETFIFGQIF